MGVGMYRLAPLVFCLALGSIACFPTARAGEKPAPPTPRAATSPERAIEAAEGDPQRAAMITLLLMLAREQGVNAPATSSQSPAAR